MALGTRFPEVHTKQALLGKEGASLLRTICRKRNHFTHKENETNPVRLRELLCHATDLCESDFISAMIAVQESRKVLHRRAVAHAWHFKLRHYRRFCKRAIAFD